MALPDKNIADDGFWLNMAAEAIYNSAERRTKSVEALKTIILWAFGLFSLGGFTLTLFGSLKEFNFWALIAFGITFFFLAISYMLANRALYPVAQQVNVNDVASIKTGVSSTIETQTIRFKWAAGVTAAGFFCLAIGLLLQFGLLKTPGKEKTLAVQWVMKTGIQKNGTTIFIPVTIMGKKNESIGLSFINSSSFDDVENTAKQVFSSVFYTDSLGRFYYSYQLTKDSVKTLIVKATVKEKLTGDTGQLTTYLQKVTITK